MACCIFAIFAACSLASAFEWESLSLVQMRATPVERIVSNAMDHAGSVAFHSSVDQAQQAVPVSEDALPTRGELKKAFRNWTAVKGLLGIIGGLDAFAGHDGEASFLEAVSSSLHTNSNLGSFIHCFPSSSCEESKHMFWWCRPEMIFVWCLILFTPPRLVFGGSKYIGGKTWIIFALTVDVMVWIGTAFGQLTVPILVDGPTVLHATVALFYIQCDLLVARWLVGPQFGCFNALTLTRKNLAKNGLGISLMELLGATVHEIFWTGVVCQNFINHRYWSLTALLMVPITSCVSHAIVSSNAVGWGMFPAFLAVALAFHASGSIVMPIMIHASWYLCGTRFTHCLGWVKHEWDRDERRVESGAQVGGISFILSIGIILVIYVPLNEITYNYPELKSIESLKLAAARAGKPPIFWPLHCPKELCLMISIIGLVGGQCLFWKPLCKAATYVGESGDQSMEGKLEATKIFWGAPGMAEWARIFKPAEPEAKSSAEILPNASVGQMDAIAGQLDAMVGHDGVAPIPDALAAGLADIRAKASVEKLLQSHAPKNKAKSDASPLVAPNKALEDLQS